MEKLEAMGKLNLENGFECRNSKDGDGQEAVNEHYYTEEGEFA